MNNNNVSYYLSQLEDTNIIAWILNNNIVTERGFKFDFEKFSFMIDPYLDWSPLQGTRKASQCGWSVMTNIKLFYAAQHGIPKHGIDAANVIYTLPSDSDVNEFVPSKTNALVNNNPILKMSLADDSLDVKRNVDSIRRKRIGNSFVYFKGTKSKTAALMITSDLNIHDESDRSEKFIIEQYESRLATSPYKGRWIFSNPSAPNMPADLLYQASDQKHWFIKHERCGHWQYLDWVKMSGTPLNRSSIHSYIDDTNGFFICPRCGKPITDENRKRGKWVKKYQNKAVSGYWVSHMMYSWLSVNQLLATESEKSKDYFMNFVLGLPYVGSDVVVDATTIVNNIVLDSGRKWERGKVAMGVDNGDMKHYVIGDTQGIFEVGKTKSWDDIELLIQKYQPVTVIDLNPYPAKPRELAQKYRRVYCSFYTDNTKDYVLVKWGDRDKKFMVYPDRNRVLDDMIGYIAEGGMKFFRAKVYWEEYISHWESMYRADMIGTRKVDEVGSSQASTSVVRGVWQSSTGEDHFCHATVYYYVALSKLVAGGGQVLKQGATLKEAISEASGRSIPTVPDVNEGKMSPVRSYIPDLTKKPDKKPAAVSGNM